MDPPSLSFLLDFSVVMVYNINMVSKILIDVELSMTQEDFLLFKKTSDLLSMSMGDVIISCARDRVREVLNREGQESKIDTTVS